MENQDLKALNELVEEYTNKESELATVEHELATRDEQFANFITTQKRLAEQKQVLTELIKEEMNKRGLREHETDTVILKLSPLGKYRLAEGYSIDDARDEICEVKKTLSNKKIKAFYDMYQALPQEVESLGDRLTIRVKES